MEAAVDKSRLDVYDRVPTDNTIVEIIEAVTIPVMAKCRIGHFVEAQVLEALADALTSLEYYIESIGKSEDRNVDLLKLAESSLDDVGL
mgnify:CR=1 FL=1